MSTADPRHPTQTTTVSGVQIDVLRPMAKDILLVDIAHHLSMMCRFNGATRYFYSNAEHSVRVSRETEVLLLDEGFADQYGRLTSLGAKVAIGALLHDSPEAYLCDLTAPVKAAVRQGAALYGFASPFDVLNGRFSRAIEDAFHLIPGTVLGGHPLIDRAHAEVWTWEDGFRLADSRPPGACWEQPLAKDAFIDRFDELSSGDEALKSVLREKKG